MTNLPSGTVSFLFTDIEGSTRLAQAEGGAWPAQQARHHAILRAACEARQGYVFQIAGDAFSVAFATAADALTAAMTAQRALQAEPWGDGEIRVRMGLHTGAAILLDGEYEGYLTLAQAQRVMSVAYGGQTLLSNATAALLSGQLPSGLTLRDMGEHRLKGLLNPERLWQVVAPDLPTDFPPLTSLNAIPNNLPIQVTSFIGRERELAELQRLLPETRLLTLTGSGGTGKTRLSLQLAAGVLDAFKDGVWFVELAPLSDPALVPNSVASLLGVRAEPGRVLRETLLEWLHDKQLLLILDNCEHLIEACAQFADAIMHRSRATHILASSREALGIAGESAYRVPSLETPNPAQADHISITRLEQYAAVRLFIDRATQAQRTFMVTNANAPSIAQICYRLDGIPLAIELAAARVKAVPVDKIAERLDDRFRLLTGGSRTALPRQQTLRALIDWSYSLLSEPERILLRRLAVFAGGWTLEAAEEVCSSQSSAASSQYPTTSRQYSVISSQTKDNQQASKLTTDDRLLATDILDLLARLVDKSLVVLEERETGARYHMLETIRQYARDKLLDSGEAGALRDRHLEYLLAFGQTAWSHFFDAQHNEWIGHVQQEQDNVRAALEWALVEHPEAALQLGGHLSLYWLMSAYPDEGMRLLQLGLERTAALPPVEGELARARQIQVARAQLGMATLQNQLGVTTTAKKYAEQALPIWRALGTQPELATTLMAFGATSLFLGDGVAARASIGEAISMLRSLPYPWALAFCLSFGALVAIRLDRDIAAARARLEESIRIFRAIGDEPSTAAPLGVLGELEYLTGNYAQSRTAYEASLAANLEAGNRGQVNAARSGLAGVEWRIGNYGVALAGYREAIAEWQRMGSRGGIARCLECIAFVWLAQAAGEHTQAELLPRAARLLGAAEQLRETTHASMNPTEQGEYQDQVARLCASLDDGRCTSEWADGRALSMEQAIALAQG